MQITIPGDDYHGCAMNLSFIVARGGGSILGKAFDERQEKWRH
jgi:hypothetical protein